MGKHIANAARAESPRFRLWDANSGAVRRKSVASTAAPPIQYAVRDKSWRPGQLNPNLTVKKIPRQMLSRCEWCHDDCSLRVENLPQKPPEPGQQVLDLD